MNALVLILTLLGPTPGGTRGTPQSWVHPSTYQLHLNDNIPLSAGNTWAAPDIWLDVNGTVLALTSTSVDGGGTDGDLFTYALGGNAIVSTATWVIPTLTLGGAALAKISSPLDAKLTWNKNDGSTNVCWDFTADGELNLFDGDCASTQDFQVNGIMDVYRIGTDAASDGAFGFRVRDAGSFEFTGAAGNQYGGIFRSEVNNTGSAAFTQVLSDLTGTTGGSGNQYLFEGRRSGAEKFSVDEGGMVLSVVHTETIADDEGGTNATATLTPTSNVVICDCDDANGCDVTMGETGMKSGMIITISCVTATTCEFADTDGVSNLTGAFSCGDDDVLSMKYSVDEWVETSRSDN